MFLGMVALGNSMYATYRIVKVFLMSVKIVPFFLHFQSNHKSAKKKKFGCEKKKVLAEKAFLRIRFKCVVFLRMLEVCVLYTWLFL